MSEYKQVILVRKDLKLPKGKMSVQVAHASVEAVLRSDKTRVSSWRNSGMKKVALEVSDLKELHKYMQQAKDLGMITSIITDAGRTTVEPGTVTCGAIGPDTEENIDRITGKLKII